MHFWDPSQWYKCVLSILESYSIEKHGSKFSHLLTVRADRADPPPLLTVSLAVKYPHFFGDSPKQCLWFCWEGSKLMGKNAYFCVLLRIFFGENMPTEEKGLLLGIVLITRKSNQKWIFVRLRWPVVKVTGNVFLSGGADIQRYVSKKDEGS